MSIVNRIILKLTFVTCLVAISAVFLNQTADANGNQNPNFKWVYRYDHATQIGALHVYPLDEATCQEKGEKVFASVCVDNGDHVACTVNIQERVNEVLSDVGFKETAPSIDYYPGIYAEITGAFDTSQSKIDGAIINHPSVEFNIDASLKHAAARFDTQWSNAASASGSFPIGAGTQTMLATFGASRFYHVGNGAHINTQWAGVGQIPFQLDETTFRFYNQPGFQLETAEIDPSKCGWG